MLSTAYTVTQELQQRGACWVALHLFSCTLSHVSASSAVLLQNGQLKARIPGANMPLLSSSIYEFTPANADMDDLEVRLVRPG